MTQVPGFLMINRFVCNTTNELVGADDVKGVMGAFRFNIGKFSKGDDRELNMSWMVPDGETLLRIIESDLIGDDEIGTIDLTQNLDQETTTNVQGQGTNYDITYTVTSTTVDSPASDTGN